eukprot:m.48638 g.48638  ORF g.48638 m.48638 type:complete len:840 (+) comp8924_c0_seq2:113-2632(+)
MIRSAGFQVTRLSRVALCSELQLPPFAGRSVLAEACRRGRRARSSLGGVTSLLAKPSLQPVCDEAVYSAIGRFWECRRFSMQPPFDKRGFFDTMQDHEEQRDKESTVAVTTATPPTRKKKKNKHSARSQATVTKKLELERRRLAGGDILDMPDRIPADIATELLKQSEKVKADDDRKRHEMDSFWVHRSFPRSTIATLWLSLGGNVLIAAAKFIAYSRTGHSAMLSEAIHTLVDVVNQTILGYGLREASKAPDKSYQYGYGRAAFFYSLLSALSTFGFGAVYTFAHGIDTLWSPPESLATTPETWGVLGVALLVDGFVLTTAWKDVSKRAHKRKMTPLEWIFSFRDPFTVAVIFEDSAAVAGVVIAAAGIGLTHITGSVYWDSAATLAIATLLGGVSLKLVQLNRSFILGRPVETEITDGISQLLLTRKSVDAVYDVQSQWIGPQAFSYSADIDFDGTYLAAQVFEQYAKEIHASIASGTIEHDLKWLMPCFAEDVARVIEREVREIKAEIRKEYKDAAFIDIIPDSSQTASALEGMISASRHAEQNVLMALLDTLPSEDDADMHWSFFKLGTTYQATGQHEKAIGPLTTALVAREERFGRTHPLTAMAMVRLGHSYVERGSHEKAVQILQRAITILENEPVSECGIVLSEAISSLAEAHSQKGILDVAIDLRTRAADIGREVYEDDMQIAELDFALATDKARLAIHRDDAFVLLRSVQDRFREVGESARVAQTLDALGRLHKKEYRLDSAAECFQEQLEIVQELHGVRSAESADCLIALGNVLMEQGNRASSERALEYLHEAHQIRVEIFGPAHPDVEFIAEAVLSLRRALGIPGRVF